MSDSEFMTQRLVGGGGLQTAVLSPSFIAHSPLYFVVSSWSSIGELGSAPGRSIAIQNPDRGSGTKHHFVFPTFGSFKAGRRDWEISLRSVVLAGRLGRRFKHFLLGPFIWQVAYAPGILRDFFRAMPRRCASAYNSRRLRSPWIAQSSALWTGDSFLYWSQVSKRKRSLNGSYVKRRES